VPIKNRGNPLMRKLIYISQRVDIAPDYGERRDALDQRWAKFLLKAGYIAIPMCNCPEMLEDLLKFQPPGGILLSGGNSPVAYGGTASERDDTDVLLIEYALKNKIPLLGCCRGMQSIILHFEGTLFEVENHVSVRHKLQAESKREVNSYHKLAVHRLPESFIETSCALDGVTESVQHIRLPIAGIMWHPEREDIFDKNDIKLIQRLFG